MDLVRVRALETPGRTAIVFLNEEGKEDVRFTYADLDRAARAIASELQDVAERGSRALLVFEPGPHYLAAFLGCLYAGVVAVPVYPPELRHLRRSLPRLRSILANAEAEIAVVSSMVQESRRTIVEALPEIGRLRWVCTENIGPERAGAWHEPTIDPNALAFLQYTSGSTSEPKGVMLAHANLLANLDRMTNAIGGEPDDVLVSWLPPYHDMGLIGGLLWPLHRSALGISMSPLTFLKRPYRWLEAISRYRATISVAPNFGYDLCVRKISPNELEMLDLGSWLVALSGSEPVRRQTLEKFHGKFGPRGFRWEAHYPSYGLAEATLMVSGGKRQAPPRLLSLRRGVLSRCVIEEAGESGEDRVDLVGCGTALRGQDVVVVDPDTRRLCGPDEVGEIWVSGPSVARGYWGRPEETSRLFAATLALAEEQATHPGPFLRTQDLGFVRGNEIFIVGRLKDVMTLRGRNHYPEDVELTVGACHPQLRAGSGAVFQVDSAGGDGIVIVHEASAEHIDLGAMASRIRETVWEEHRLVVDAVVILAPRTIHKTSSGKIQRGACRSKFLQRDLEGVIGEWRRRFDAASG